MIPVRMGRRIDIRPLRRRRLEFTTRHRTAEVWPLDLADVVNDWHACRAGLSLKLERDARPSVSIQHGPGEVRVTGWVKP